MFSIGEVSIFSTLSSFKELGPSFDANLFVYFAQSYKLFGASLGELCEHNSDVWLNVTSFNVIIYTL